MYWLLCNSRTKHRVELIFKKRLYSIFVLLYISVNKIIYTAIYIKQGLSLWLKNKPSALVTVKHFYYYVHNIRTLGRRTHELHGYMLMTLDSFWTLLSSRSPFLMVSWYCQFLLSGLQRTQVIQSPAFMYRQISRSSDEGITCWFPQFHSLYRFYSGDDQRLWIGTVPYGRGGHLVKEW